jgi:adenylylsulfate kinase
VKILIMGLPGSGKTYLAERLQKQLNCAWYNADAIRKMANDWDFTPEGRIRQARRMEVFSLFEKNHGRTVMCDFICPTQQTRNIFDADFTIWMNTIPAGRFEDTNRIFEPPSYADLVIEKFLTDEEIEQVANKIVKVQQ